MKRTLWSIAAVLTLTVSMTSMPAAAADAAPAEEKAAPAPAAVITCSPDEIVYAGVDFDYAEEIAAKKEAVSLVPEAAAIPLTVEDAAGVTGVQLAESAVEGNAEDIYLNAYLAGDELTFSGQGDVVIETADSSVNGDLEVTDGAVTYVPAPVSTREMEDEIIRFTLSDGSSFQLHTIPEKYPAVTVTGEGAAEVFYYDRTMRQHDKGCGEAVSFPACVKQTDHPA